MAYGGIIETNINVGSEMDEEDDSITVKDKVASLSLDDSDIQSTIFVKPACLIYTDSEGLLAIDRNVLSQLSKIERKLSVVGICGLYRTGKSYLMNWLADERTGFALGDTVQSKTKGIWLWCIDHPKHNDQVLVLIDTEGLDDPEKGDQDHDNKLFCLTMLLSSVLIVNIKGVFDYSALDKLATLSDEIKILSQNDDEESNAKNIPVASPRLIMCIRDFQLKTEKDGRSLTPDEYLEECLEPSLKKGRNHEKFNNTKKSIKNYFPKRKCFTLPHPATGTDLQNLEKLDPQSLTKEFVTDVNRLMKYVHERKPKRICNASRQTIDGADLASLITTYIEALRNETPIQCESAYTQAAKQHNERVLQKVLQEFKAQMDKGIGYTSKQKLQDLFLQQHEVTLSKYRNQCFVYEQDFYEDKAVEDMKTYVNRIKVDISKKCKEIGSKWLSETYKKLLEENRSKYMTVEGYRQYEADMDKLQKKFETQMKDFDQDDVLRCLSDFKNSVSDDKMKLYRAATGKIDKKSYRKYHEDIENTLNARLEQAIIVEMTKRNRYLEEELGRLKEYVDLSKKETQKKRCIIM